jgi:Zn-dependent protease with chaperone function
MKRYIALAIAWIANIQNTYAAEDLWVFGSDNSCGIKQNDMRTWAIHIENIPCMIQWMINFFLWIAGTIAVIFVIIWAYKILFGSLSQDKTKWKDTIIMALTGFAIATLSWFIIKILLDNFN